MPRTQRPRRADPRSSSHHGTAPSAPHRPLLPRVPPPRVHPPLHSSHSNVKWHRGAGVALYIAHAKPYIWHMSSPMYSTCHHPSPSFGNCIGACFSGRVGQCTIRPNARSTPLVWRRRGQITVAHTHGFCQATHTILCQWHTRTIYFQATRTILWQCTLAGACRVPRQLDEAFASPRCAQEVPGGPGVRCTPTPSERVRGSARALEHPHMVSRRARHEQSHSKHSAENANPNAQSQLSAEEACLPTGVAVG